MKKVVFVLTENIKFDGRVQKEINTLQKHNIKVELIVDRFVDDDINNYNFNIHVLNGINIKGNNFVANFIRNVSFNIKAAKLIRKINPDYVHCNDLNTLLSGVLSKKKNEVIYDAHELYVEKKTGPSKYLWRLIEYVLIPRVNRIIVPEKNRIQYLKGKYGEKKRFYLVENFPEKMAKYESNFFYEKYKVPRGNKILSYIGIISEERGIENVLKAISMTEGIIFVCVGPISNNYLSKLKGIIANLNIEEKVFIKPPIKNSDVIHATHSSDIGMVFYKNTNLNNYYCASNKLYEYITCSVPVLTNDYPGLIEVVNKVKCGINLSSLSTEELVKGLNFIKENEFEFNNSENYYWHNQNKELLSVYDLKIN